MYRKYYNEYEKRAEEMRRAVPAAEQESKPLPLPQERQAKSEDLKQEENKKLPGILSKFKTDDLLLGALIFFLLREEHPDQTLIIALAFIFISGF